MSDTVQTAIIAAIAAAVGAVGQYINARRMSAESSENVQLTTLVATMQAELNRANADNARLTAIVMEQIEAMRDAAAQIAPGHSRTEQAT